MEQKFKIEKNRKGKFNIYEQKKFLFFKYWSIYQDVTGSADCTYVFVTRDFNSYEEAKHYINNKLKWKSEKKST